MKHLGFSMDEIREMTMTDFMVYADLTIPDGDVSPETNSGNEKPATSRMATQADIDNLFFS